MLEMFVEGGRLGGGWERGFMLQRKWGGGERN